MIQKKINLEKACKMSLNHTLFKNPGILKIKENKEIWIIYFYNKDNPNETYYGNIPVLINKKTGELNAYPTQFYFDEIRKAKKVKIPKAYH